MSEVNAVYIENGKKVGAAPTMLDNMTDVNVVNPTGGQALIYDSTNSVWSNVSIPSPVNKADKVVGATAGNLAALDADGNLVDSGYSVTTLSGTIPINPSSTSGMNIWIETE